MARLLGEVPYAGAATVTLAIPDTQCRPIPEAAGFVVSTVERRTVLATTFVHRKYAGRTPDGMVHLRAFVGGALRESDLDLDDAELIRRVVADLRDLIGLRGEPSWYRICRWFKAMCQPHLGHMERTAAIRARSAAIPGLDLIGNGYEGVGIPDLCDQAERMVGVPAA